VTDDTADQEALELLRELGPADAPDPAVLAAARESLWSAIADELLLADRTADGGQPQQREAPRPDVRPRHGRAQQPRRHRTAGD
jgi:hypothetical protein